MPNPILLSIVIPYYHETPADVFPILSSLNNQVGIDYRRVEVLLVNDGADNVFDVAFLALFRNLNMRTIQLKENRGPGVARQAGLDAAKGEYVMFCDADDTLHSVAVLGVFMQELDATRPDILTSPWLEEMLADGRYSYLTHEDEATWMHGKAFRVAFLRDNGLRFHEKLRIHEDSYFLGIAFETTRNARKLPVTSYVWKYLPQSITRKNEAAYTYDSMPTFNEALMECFAELERRGLTDGLPYKVVQLVMYTYFTMSQEHWLQKPDAREKAETSFTEAMLRFMPYFDMMPPEQVRLVYNQERAKRFADGLETETLDHWLNRIGLRCEGGDALASQNQTDPRGELRAI